MEIKAAREQLDFDFEKEWANLPRGEGVTRTGKSALSCEVSQAEQDRDAWDFMSEFLKRGS